jgi:hypothetical protein
MGKLRNLILYLTFGLAVLFNIERLDFGVENEINILTFVYFLALGIVLATIFYQRLARLPVSITLPAWLMVYLALRIFLFNERPLLGGVYSYLTITEIALLALLTFLAHQVATELNEFDKAVLMVSVLRGRPQIPPIEDSQDRILAELNRSRHYNSPLSLIVVDFETSGIPVQIPRILLNMQKEMVDRYLQVRIGEMIRPALRRMDLLLDDQANNRLLILTPEVKVQDTQILIDRIRQDISSHLQIDAAFGVASFPDEALTFEDLIQEASRHKVKTEMFQAGKATSVNSAP